MFVALPASIANLEHLESLNLWNNVLEVMYYSSYILVHWCLHCYIPFLTCRSCLLLSVLWGIWKYWMLGKSTNIIILCLWVSQSNSLSSSWLLYGNWLLCYVIVWTGYAVYPGDLVVFQPWKFWIWHTIILIMLAYLKTFVDLVRI